MRIFHYTLKHGAPIVCGLSREQHPKLFTTTDLATKFDRERIDR